MLSFPSSLCFSPSLEDDSPAPAISTINTSNNHSNNLSTNQKKSDSYSPIHNLDVKDESPTVRCRRNPPTSPASCHDHGMEMDVRSMKLNGLFKENSLLSRSSSSSSWSESDPGSQDSGEVLSNDHTTSPPTHSNKLISDDIDVLSNDYTNPKPSPKLMSDRMGCWYDDDTFSEGTGYEGLDSPHYRFIEELIHEEASNKKFEYADPGYQAHGGENTHNGDNENDRNDFEKGDCNQVEEDLTVEVLELVELVDVESEEETQMEDDLEHQNHQDEVFKTESFAAAPTAVICCVSTPQRPHPNTFLLPDEAISTFGDSVYNDKEYNDSNQTQTVTIDDTVIAQGSSDRHDTTNDAFAVLLLEPDTTAYPGTTNTSVDEDFDGSLNLTDHMSFNNYNMVEKGLDIRNDIGCHDSRDKISKIEKNARCSAKHQTFRFEQGCIGHDKSMMCDEVDHFDAGMKLSRIRKFQPFPINTGEDDAVKEGVDEKLCNPTLEEPYSDNAQGTAFCHAAIEQTQSPEFWLLEQQQQVESDDDGAPVSTSDEDENEITGHRQQVLQISGKDESLEVSISNQVVTNSFRPESLNFQENDIKETQGPLKCHFSTMDFMSAESMKKVRTHDSTSDGATRSMSSSSGPGPSRSLELTIVDPVQDSKHCHQNSMNHHCGSDYGNVNGDCSTDENEHDTRNNVLMLVALGRNSTKKSYKEMKGGIPKLVYVCENDSSSSPEVLQPSRTSRTASNYEHEIEDAVVRYIKQTPDDITDPCSHEGASDKPRVTINSIDTYHGLGASEPDISNLEWIPKLVLFLSSDNRLIVEAAMSELAQMACIDDRSGEDEEVTAKSVITTAYDVGAHSSIVGSMNKWYSNEQIQILGCRALHNFSIHKDFRDSAGRVGAFETLLQAIDNFPDSVELQRLGCACLCCLSANKERVFYLVLELRGLEPMSVIMKRYPNDDFVQLWSCSALNYMSHFSELYSALDECGAMSVLFHAIKHFTDSSNNDHCLIQHQSRDAVKRLL